MVEDLVLLGFTILVIMVAGACQWVGVILIGDIQVMDGVLAGVTVGLDGVLAGAITAQVGGTAVVTHTHVIMVVEVAVEAIM